ncbi:MAG: hypothetical protein ACK5YI_19695, partial [Rhodospirillales bacterium]
RPANRKPPIWKPATRRKGEPRPHNPTENNHHAEAGTSGRWCMIRVSISNTPPAMNTPRTQTQGRSPEKGPAVQTADVIESQIDGDFEGWEGDTIFKLVNGQIWQQVSYSYKYHYAFMPRVLIVRVGAGFQMQVQGVQGRIALRQLR